MKRNAPRSATVRHTLVLGVVLTVVAAVLGGCGRGRDSRAAVPSRPPSRSISTPAVGRPAPSPAPLPRSVALSVPHLQQLPELKNGSEVTSLAMLLAAVGHPVDKMTLARRLPVDPTPVVFRSGGAGLLDVERWGDPRSGFVGNVRGYIGYGIYARALLRLLDEQLPGRGLDLSGRPFNTLLAHVAAGTPVLVWTTTTFRPTSVWVTWQSPRGPVHATPYEHAVVVSGFDPGHLLIADPLSDDVVRTVDRQPFEQAWRQLGEQAITVAD